jgi:hypothetical protein
VTGAADLERGYRRWLRWYPRTFRHEHEAEVLGVLMAGAREGQRRPDPVECLDLLRGALSMRLRPGVPRRQRAAVTAVRLMYLGAVVELAAAVTILATIGSVRSGVVQRNPGYPQAQWHAVVAGKLAPTAVAAGIAVAFWLWMAWANGRGHRWARILFALFFGVNAFGLGNGLAGGSAVYARADLAVGTVLCLVHLVAVALLFDQDVRRIAGHRSSAG